MKTGSSSEESDIDAEPIRVDSVDVLTDPVARLKRKIPSQRNFNAEGASRCELRSVEAKIDRSNPSGIESRRHERLETPACQIGGESAAGSGQAEFVSAAEREEVIAGAGGFDSAGERKNSEMLRLGVEPSGAKELRTAESRRAIRKKVTSGIQKSGSGSNDLSFGFADLSACDSWDERGGGGSEHETAKEGHGFSTTQKSSPSG